MLNKEEIEVIKEYLQKHFPKAFPVDELVILKKGILNDIYTSGILNNICISKAKLNKFLSIYTRRYKYLTIHKEGCNRYDLDGNIFGKVLAGEEEYAQAIIANRKLLKNNKCKIDHPVSGSESKSKYTGTLKLNWFLEKEQISNSNIN